MEKEILSFLSHPFALMGWQCLWPQGLCTPSPIQGKTAGNTIQQRVPRSLDSGSCGLHLTHTDPVCVHLEHALQQNKSDSHKPKWSQDQHSYFPTVGMTRWEGLPSMIQQGSGKAGTKNPGWLVSIIFLQSATKCITFWISNKEDHLISSQTGFRDTEGKEYLQNYDVKKLH